MTDFEPFDDDLAIALQRRAAQIDATGSARRSSIRRAPTVPCSPGPAESVAAAPASPEAPRWQRSSPAACSCSTATPTTRWPRPPSRRRRSRRTTSASPSTTAVPLTSLGPETSTRESMPTASTAPVVAGHRPSPTTALVHDAGVDGRTSAADIDRRSVGVANSSSTSSSSSSSSSTSTTIATQGPAPFTKTYASSGGSITVSWNGSALSLDAVNPAAGHDSGDRGQRGDADPGPVPRARPTRGSRSGSRTASSPNASTDRPNLETACVVSVATHATRRSECSPARMRGQIGNRGGGRRSRGRRIRARRGGVRGRQPGLGRARARGRSSQHHSLEQPSSRRHGRRRRPAPARRRDHRRRRSTTSRARRRNVASIRSTPASHGRVDDDNTSTSVASTPSTTTTTTPAPPSPAHHRRRRRPTPAPSRRQHHRRTTTVTSTSSTTIAHRSRPRRSRRPTRRPAGRSR